MRSLWLPACDRHLVLITQRGSPRLLSAGNIAARASRAEHPPLRPAAARRFGWGRPGGRAWAKGEVPSFSWTFQVSHYPEKPQTRLYFSLIAAFLKHFKECF